MSISENGDIDPRWGDLMNALADAVSHAASDRQVLAEEFQKIIEDCEADLRCELEAFIAAKFGFLPQSERILPNGARLSITSDFEIGELVSNAGGMGEVYAARDLTLQREVAIKVMKKGARGRALNALTLRDAFFREPKAIAGLDHPAIVHVHGLGSADVDPPFYVMRLIPTRRTLAEAIQAFFRSNVITYTSSEFRCLLGYLEDVCRAVDSAHENGTIHCDVKPSNIVIDQHDKAILLDWGLSRSAKQPAELSVVGTPGYMSPEQVTGSVLGEASDIYNLGATLFTVLTGTAPFRVKDLENATDRKAYADAVRAGNFQSPIFYQRRIPKRLQAICLKAMALKPGDRYASAKRLADDLAGWLSDEPGEAYRESALEHAARWSRKHPKAQATIAATVLFSTVGSLAFGIYNSSMNASLRLQRTRAEIREDRTIQAIARFRDVIVKHKQLKDEKTLGALRQDLLTEPVQLLEELTILMEQDKETRPAALVRLATAYEELGATIDQLGRLDDSLRAFLRAREIWDRLLSKNPQSSNFKKRLSRCLNEIGSVQTRKGEKEKAVQSFERAAAELGAVHNFNEADPDRLRERIGIQLNLISVLADLKRYDEASESYKLAEKYWKQLSQADSANPSTLVLRAKLHINRGNMLAHQAVSTSTASDRTRLIDELAAELKNAEAILTDKALSENETLTINLGHTLHDLAMVRANAKDFTQARTLEDRAIAVREGLARNSPTVTEFQFDLGRSIMARASLSWILTEEREKTRAFHERAEKIFRALVAGDPSIAAYQDNLGLLLYEMASFAKQSQEWARAKNLFEESLTRLNVAAQRDATLPSRDTYLPPLLSQLIEVYVEVGDPDGVARAALDYSSLKRVSETSKYHAAGAVSVALTFIDQKSLGARERTQRCVDAGLTVLKRSGGVQTHGRYEMRHEPELEAIRAYSAFETLYDVGWPKLPFARTD